MLQRHGFREQVRGLFHDFEERLAMLVDPSAGPELGPPRWLVAARLEDERSDFRPDDRITPSLLRDFVETFDQDVRRVPVIGAQGELVPAHWADPLPPLGRVVSIERDAINLWMELRSFIDPVLELPRIDVAVSDGFTQQSIGFRRASNETGGRGSIWHLAILSEGEPPGIANMPRLDEMGFGLGEEDRSKLREARGRQTEGERELANKFGFAVRRSLESEWREFGGVGHFREIAAELQYRTAHQLAARIREAGGEDLIQEVLRMPEQQIEEQTREATEEAGTQDLLRQLVQGQTALTSAVQSLAERSATPDELDPVEDAGDAGNTERSSNDPPAQPSHQQLAQRAAVAARRMAALGILPRNAAEDQARQAVEAGEIAVQTLERTIEQASDAREHRLFREVRVSDTETIRIDRTHRAFHGFRYQNPVDESRLEILALAQAREAKANPEARGGIRPDRLMARIQEVATEVRR